MTESVSAEMTVTSDKNEPAEQLLTVLDVLWDEMLFRIGEGAAATPTVDEVTTALWQVHELVFAMAAELDRAYDLLERMIEDQKQRESVRSILLGADGRPMTS